MEGEVDFDPTTDQVDINDEEYESLMPDENANPQEFDNSLRRRFGNRWRSAALQLKEKWLSRNPGSQVPEYLELTNLEQDPITAAKEKLQNEYENFNFDEVKLLEEKGVVKIRVKNQKNQKWTKAEKLFTEDGQIRQRVLELKGFVIASRGLLERLDTLNERVALEQRVQDLQETLEEREADYMKQNKLLLDSQKREMDDKNQLVMEFREKRDQAFRDRDQAQKAFELALKELNISKEEAKNLHITIDGSLVERQQIMAEIKTKKEQLRQRDQAIEDLERQMDQTKAVMQDEARTEEQREAAQKDFEELQERLAELQGQKEKLETELGLTTKEKIKRALVKYGIPLAFAVAVSSVVGVILTSLKGVGNGVKKVGKGLKDLGKRMAAAMPGLLGSVIAFALRAGGELLKFVGNNIWILVVAIGVVLMKRMKV